LRQIYKRYINYVATPIIDLTLTKTTA
jgi:hypothetical protein